MSTTRSRAITAALSRVALPALLAFVALAPGASAERRTFKPAAKSSHAVVFRLSGLSAERVRSAHASLRHKDGGKVKRRVRARRVRRAVQRHSRLRVHRPHSTRSGRLIVVLKRRRGAGRGCGTPVALRAIASSTSGCWRPYSDDSPFNTPVPADAPVVSNSQAIVDRWVGFGNLPKFTGGFAETDYDYDHPIYYSQPGDPVFTVQCTQWVSSCEVHGKQVRIPNRAQPAKGGDGHLSVIDTQSGQEYDFWQVLNKPSGGGTLKVSHGGVTEIGGDGLGTNATAAHFGLAAGVIRPEELAAGEINHALFLVVNCTSGQSIRPAASGAGRSCSSIGQSNSNAPRMGEHFVLDMTDAEIAATGAPEWQKTILRAMAHYGLYVGDTGGGSLKLQSGASWTSFGQADPWLRLGRELGVPITHGSQDYAQFDLRNAVNWRSQMKVVDPCVATGSC